MKTNTIGFGFHQAFASEKFLQREAALNPVGAEPLAHN
jgi:hypothetical protein